jgi:hypothetical protein
LFRLAQAKCQWSRLIRAFGTKVNNQTKVLLVFAAVAAGAFAVWNADWFQRGVFPDAYWAERVSSLEGVLEMDRGMFQDAVIEMKKLQATAKLEVQQEMSSAKSLGLSVEEARADAVESIKAQAEQLRQDIEMWRNAIAEDEKALADARRHLSELDR